MIALFILDSNELASGNVGPGSGTFADKLLMPAKVNTE